MDRNEIKNRILGIIINAGQIITADDIYSSLTREVDPGRTQETIRKYIRELVNEDRSPIGSSSRGYFEINSKERVETATLHDET